MANTGIMSPVKWGIETALKYFTRGLEVRDEAGNVKVQWFCRMKEYEEEIKCTKCVLLKPASGFTNLKSHHNSCCQSIRTTSADYIKKNNNRIKKSQSTITTIDKKSEWIYEWMVTVIEGNYPFSMVEDENIRKIVKIPTISRTTLMKFIDLVGYEVEGKLINIIPKKFAVVFDGWDGGGSKSFTGVFVVWSDKDGNVSRYLLRIASLIELGKNKFKL
jgi:hypothetical protein